MPDHILGKPNSYTRGASQKMRVVKYPQRSQILLLILFVELIGLCMHNEHSIQKEQGRSLLRYILNRTGSFMEQTLELFLPQSRIIIFGSL